MWLGIMQNTRLRSVYLLEGSQSRGRALPAYANAAEQRKVRSLAFRRRKASNSVNV